MLRRIAERGWDADTDVFFTTDHGELQGDFGLLFKGPYHCDALMRIPLVWRPAPSARRRAGRRRGAGRPARPRADVLRDRRRRRCRSGCRARRCRPRRGSGRERVLTEWDSQFDDIGMHLRTIYRDGWTCTVYEPGGGYDGTEGELYDLTDDPHLFAQPLGRPGVRDAPRRTSSPTSTTTCPRHAPTGSGSRPPPDHTRQ